MAQEHLNTIRNALSCYVEDCVSGDEKEKAAVDAAFYWLLSQTEEGEEPKPFEGKHFDTPTEALTYAFEELLATLRDDLNNMMEFEREHYEADDIAMMKDKIDDIEAAMTRVDIVERPAPVAVTDGKRSFHIERLVDAYAVSTARVRATSATEAMEIARSLPDEAFEDEGTRVFDQTDYVVFDSNGTEVDTTIGA